MTTSTANHETVIDLFEPVMFTDPFPVYAQLRREAPVVRVKARQLVRGTGYLLSRYEDVMLVHTDKRFSSDPLTQGGSAKLVRFMPRTFRLLTDSMVFKDDPDHKRLRGLVNKAFTPKMVQRMEADIEQIVDRLVDGLAGRGTVDLVDDLAVPLPLAVISGMLGVDDADRDQFHAWMRHFTEASASPVQMIRALPTGRRMIGLLERLADDRRARPDDRLVTALVEANDNGERLSDREITSMIFLLLLAGHDTTANLIGNGILALIDHPEELQRLRAHPELIDTAVEELLRFTTPVPCGAARIVLEDVDIAGVTIPRGANVLGMIISANRDESVFDAPDRLDLGRDPNRHLAVAFGSHFCLGNQLARLEGRIALRALVQRFEHIELAVPRDRLQYKPTPSLRGLRSLPLRLR
jgi:cytochrome P450 PksS